MIRDSFELLRNDIALEGYVARQSLISATNPPSDLREQVSLNSSFQTRMLQGDLNSDLLMRLRRVAQSIDLLVMDCHVERLGVQRLPNGSFITRSAELAASGLASRVPGISSEISIGTDRFRSLYEIAVKRFTQRLNYMGLLEKTIVIDAPWAEVDSEGENFPSYKGRPPGEVSENISELTEILSDHGVRKFTMPKKVIHAPVDHQWGRGPYHFGSQAMTWTSEIILSNLP